MKTTVVRDQSFTSRSPRELILTRGTSCRICDIGNGFMFAEGFSRGMEFVTPLNKVVDQAVFMVKYPGHDFKTKSGVSDGDTIIFCRNAEDIYFKTIANKRLSLDDLLGVQLVLEAFSSRYNVH